MKIRLVLFFISCGFQVYGQHFKPKKSPTELQENVVKKITERY